MTAIVAVVVSLAMAPELASSTPGVRSMTVARSAARPGPRLDIIDRIMAVVGSQPITLTDVQGAMIFGFVPAVPTATPDPLAAALDRMIERTLILVEVERYQPPEPAPEAIDARLATIRQRFPTPQAFDEALRNTGLTLDLLRRYIRDDLRMETYLNQRFGSGDPDTRARLQREWMASLRRRTEITVLYLGK